MSFNEVPDSDVEILPLTAETPVWVPLGIPFEPVKLTDQPKSCELSISNSENVPELAADLPAVSVDQEYEHDDPPLAETPPVPIKDPISLALNSKTANRPNSVYDSELSVPRRRRFDFKSWVENDKKIHEYVYQRRFKNYYGPMSDSEDEDYDVPEEKLPDLPDVEPENSADDISELDDSGSEAFDNENTDHLTGSIAGSASPRSDISSSLSAFRRKKRMVDSEDSNSEDEDSLPLFERRVTAAFPAEGPDNIPMRFDYSGEAQEDYGGIDYMQPRNRKLNKNLDLGAKQRQLIPEKRVIAPRKHDILNLARSAGRDASKGLRIAARTAKTRGQVSGFRTEISSSISALFSRKHSPQRGQEYSMRNENFLNQRIPQLFLNQSSETMQVLQSFQRSGSSSSPIAASSGTNSLKRKNTDSSSSDLLKKTKSRRRKALHQSTIDFRTTILEKEPARPENMTPNVTVRRPSKTTNSNKFGTIPAQYLDSHTSLTSSGTSHRAEAANTRKSSTTRKKTSSKHGNEDRSFPGNSSSDSRQSRRSHREVLSPNSSKSPRSSTVNSSVVLVDVNSPVRRLKRADFGSHTFVGSGLLGMFEGPANWSRDHLTLAVSGFGTPIANSNEQLVVDDCNLVMTIHESLDPTIYTELYAYFLMGTGYLCDEREIIELTFKKFVVREWLRLARGLLKYTLRHLNADRHRFRRTSRKKSTQVHWSQMLTLLVTEASFVLSQHVGIYDVSTAKKGKTLALWVLFYLQSPVSSQIDKISNTHDELNFVGAELLFTIQKFHAYASTIAKIFTRIQTIEPYWHLLLLFASCSTEENLLREKETFTIHPSQNWVNWDLVRDLLKLTIHLDPYLVMVYIRRLLVHWRWPVSSDIVNDLFGYFSKSGYYADPKGETLGLPDFLVTSEFNGYNKPSEGFSLFLEILGFTLQTLKKLSRENDKVENVSPTVIIRRLASRVTPLSSLKFPESKEVTIADLSSASHQFGLLIVLKRLLPVEIRPTVAQFRDLVVLKDAHWAIRVKVISAWSHVVKIATSPGEKEECCRWMQEILNAEYLPEPVLVSALSKVLENWEPLAVPKKRLAQVGLLSSSSTTRLKAWNLVGISKFDSKDLFELTNWQDNFTCEIDLPAIAHIIGNYHSDPGFIHDWVSRNCQDSNVRARMVYRTVAGDSVWRRNNFLRTAPYFISAALEAIITSEIIEFLIIAGIFDPNFPRSIEACSNLAGRRRIVRQLFTQISESESLCELALSVADQQSRWLSDQGPTMAATLQCVYLPLVSDLRRLIQPVFPHLVMAPKSQMLVDEYSQSLETMQSNLLSLMDHQSNHSANYYYFAYCLRKLIPTNGEPVSRSTGSSKTHYQNLNDTKFVNEVGTALHMFKASRNDFDILSSLLNLYESFFLLTSLSLERTRKNCLPLILPTVVKSARLALGWNSSNYSIMSKFITCVSVYINQLTESFLDMMHNSFTILLLKEFSVLGVSWLNQSAGHYKDYYANYSSSSKPDLPLKSVLSTVKRALDLLKTRPEVELNIITSTSSRPSSELSSPGHCAILQNPVLLKNLIATFQTQSVVEDVLEAVADRDFVELREFLTSLNYFILAYDAE